MSNEEVRSARLSGVYKAKVQKQVKSGQDYIKAKRESKTTSLGTRKNARAPQIRHLKVPLQQKASSQGRPQRVKRQLKTEDNKV